MKNIVLNVEGMSCSHCENAVKTSVGSLEGVSNVLVDLAAKTVTVDFEESNVTIDQIKNEIKDQGYDVIS